MAYQSNETDRNEIYLRPFLPGAPGGPAGAKVRVSTGGGGVPQWRRDGRELFYLADNKLMAVDVKLGATAEIGTPQRLTKLSAEQNHRWPQILPGGATVLFTASTTSIAFEDSSIEAFSLKTGEKKTLLNGGFFGRYIPASGSSGQLVYVHEGTLFGVPFDSARLELKGAPAPILGDVAADPSTGAGQFDYSANGGFIYQNGKPVSQTYPIMWFENSGAARALLAKPAFYISPRFSPDGGSLAFRIAIASGSAKGDIYVYDWRREIFTRLTFGNRQDFSPTWTPDGKHIVFRSPSPSGGSYIEWIRSDGAGETERLLDTRGLANAYSFSPDGRRVAYYEQTAETGSDLWTLPLDLSDPEHPKPGRPEPFLRTPANESFPTFSPDGRWIAYNSDETGVREVYVRPFPGPGGKWQISTGGGLFPIWARNGRDLFFETLDNHIMMVDYSASGDSFSNEKPHLWSDRQIRDMGTVFNYDLTPDGKRIVAFPPDTASIAESGSVKVSFLLNFLDELRRRVPTGK